MNEILLDLINSSVRRSENARLGFAVLRIAAPKGVESRPCQDSTSVRYTETQCRYAGPDASARSNKNNINTSINGSLNIEVLDISIVQ